MERLLLESGRHRLDTNHSTTALSLTTVGSHSSQTRVSRALDTLDRQEVTKVISFVRNDETSTSCINFFENNFSAHKASTSLLE